MIFGKDRTDRIVAQHLSKTGLAGYRLDIWYGLMAPTKTARPILDKIHDEVRRFIKLPETKKKLTGKGVEKLVTSRAEHAKVVKEDLDKYAKLIGGLNLKPSN